VSYAAPPDFPQRCQLLPWRRAAASRVTPIRPYPVPSQQAVLVLGQASQRHEQDPLLGPAGFGGNGEDLGG